MLPSAGTQGLSTVHIFCTGASRGEEVRDRTKWLIKCTPQCYGPTGCLMELAHGDALERPARLSMAGVMSVCCFHSRRLLGVKGSAGPPAATEALPHCVLLRLLKSRPLLFGRFLGW